MPRRKRRRGADAPPKGQPRADLSLGYQPSASINPEDVPPGTFEPPLSASEEMALAQRLREAREYIGLLQEDVAKALDIPRASVSAFESGERRVSSLELRRLGRLYRRPVAWLLNEEGAEFEVDAPLRRATEALSDHDKKQVLRFAEFLAGAGRPSPARG